MNRRAFVLAGVESALAASLAQGAQSERTNKMFGAYSRMRGRGDAGPGLWCYQGTAFGQKNGEPQEALLGIAGFSFNRLTVNADGTLSQHMSETGYFTDLATGSILDSWVNPFNGRAVKPGHYHTQQRVRATVDSLQSEESGRPRGETKGRIGPLVVGSDTTWVTENFSTKITLPKADGDVAPRSMVATSMAAFASLSRDLADRRSNFVPCTLTFQSISGFLPWMEMGTAPGLSVWQLLGRKVASIGACPAALRQRIGADYPGWLENPGV